MEQVRVGVLLPTRQAVAAARGGPAPIEPILRMAERAEALGFDSVWIGDSITAHPRFDAVTTMAAVAARTRRVTVGSAVILTALRHPLMLAYQMATVDLIAGGRTILGVGVAAKTPNNERQFGDFDVPFRQRIGVFEEGLVVMRRLWSEPTVTFEGRHVRIHEVRLEPKPAQAGGPPVWMGGGSAPAMRRCGERSDGWFPTSPTPEAFAASYRRVQEHARAAGRDPAAIHPANYLTVNVNPDADRAAREMEASGREYYGPEFERIAAHQGHVAGTADGVAARLRDFCAAGARTLVLRLGAADQDAQLERCADLLPRLR
jgi:alkanesulfonate monooxygenase SsuD/methylene tetrahydromethanopterin reductase-like flavin-dependent oxidoreductase (luciferase family)